MKAKIYLMLLLASFVLIGCSDDEDNRITPEAKIVAIKIDEKLYNTDKTVDDPKSDIKVFLDEAGKTLRLVLAPGEDLSNKKTEILVSNGQILNFENKEEYDLRKPFTIDVDGEDGQKSTWKITIQSPPKILRVSVDDPIVSQNETFIIEKSFTIITQIEEGTDVSALKVSYDITNGTFVDYVNGSEINYAEPYELKVLGLDETTIYTYKVIFTTESVGPATIDGIEIDGVPVVDFTISENTYIVQPYVEYIGDYSNVNLNFIVSSTNIIDESFNPEGLNLYENPKVSIEGIDGITIEFTIKAPLLKPTPLVELLHEDLMYAANSGSSAAFSGSNILIASHAMAAGAPAALGINVYDLSGNYIKGLSKTGINFDGGAVNGVRKFATDADGKILGVQLGAGAGAATTLNVFKWNSVDDAAPTSYITYSQTGLGLAFAPRSAGINIEGSLAENATITVPMAQKQTVLVWTVTGGVLNPTPQIKNFPHSGTGYYYSVQPMNNKFIGAFTSSALSGVNLMDSDLLQEATLGSGVTTDVSAIIHNDRHYIAYTAFNGTKHIFKITDITDKNNQLPIMSLDSRASGNGNATTDADFAVIGGKLHVLFYGTNDGAYVYKIEE